MNEREVILVLPTTFLVTAFLNSTNTSTVSDFMEKNLHRFLANLIIEVASSYLEPSRFTASSSVAFDEFDRKLKEKGIERDSTELLIIFKQMVLILDIPSINKLSDQESMIAIANRLYESSPYDPIIIIDPSSRDNYRTAANRFYGVRARSKVNAELPFRLFDPREVRVFLERRFPDETKKVMERTPEPNRYF